MSRITLRTCLVALSLLVTAPAAHANFIGTINSYPAETRVSNFVPGNYKVVSQVKDGPNGIFNATRKKGGRYQATGVRELDDFGFYHLKGSSYVMFSREKGEKRVLYLLVDRLKDGTIIAYDTIYLAGDMLDLTNDEFPIVPVTEMFPKPAKNKALFKLLYGNGDHSSYPVLFTATPVK